MHLCLALALLLSAASQLHAQSGDTVSIIPLGDSLTWGYDGGPDTAAYLASLDDGGYRAPLDQALTAQGVTVNYVGVSTENGGLPQDGFNGYTISEISANLDGYMAVSPIINDYGGYWLSGGGGTNRGPETADVVLLQIGANDLGAYSSTGSVTPDQAAANTAASLKDLINKVLMYEPRAMLLVDGTSPLLDGPFYSTASQDYDLDVQSLIASQPPMWGNVHYVNMWSAIISDPYTTYYPGDQLYETDGVHLNANGYFVMSQAWDDAITKDYLDELPDAVPEPSTYALFAGGALALFVWRRLRRAS